MLAQLSNSFRSKAALRALLLLSAMALVSCATHTDPQLVADPSAQRESSMPWNQQEKWESQGQFGPLAEQQNGGRR